MFAAEQGYLEIVDLLLNAKANINAKDNFGNTALTFTAEIGNYSVAKALIDRGADVNADKGTALRIVSQVEDGTRLLRWFGRHFPSMPNAEFHKLCRGGQIRVNSSRVRGTEVLRSGDAVRIPPTIAGYAAEEAKKTESGNKFSLSDLEQLRKCIIHSDDDIVVFDKPAGLAVQGGTGIRKSIDKMTAALFPYAKV